MDKINQIESMTKNSTLWSSITEILTRLIAPIVNMILARLLTPEAFGVIATVNMIVSFADMFTDAGFQKFLIQHDFKSKKEFFHYTNVAFWTNLFISMLGWCIIFVFSEKIAIMTGNEGLGTVIWIAALSLPITSFSSIQSAHYRRNFEFKSLFFVRLITSFVPLIVTVPLAVITRSYWAMVIGSLSSNLVSAVCLTIKSEWKPGFYYNVANLKDMFSFSWWILIESIVVWLASYIGTFIVGVYMTQADVGYYKTAMTTVNQILTLITTATSAPLFSGLSATKHDKERFQELYYRFIRAVGVFLVPLGVGIYIFRVLLTNILLGEQWLYIADFIGLWALVNVFSILWGTYCNGVYNALGRPQLSVLAQVTQLALLIPTIIVGCKLGFEVLYKARSLVRLELIIIQFILMRFCVKINPIKYIFQSWKTMCCTALMAIFGSVIVYVFSNLFIQFVGILFCIIIYFSMYYILFRKDLIEAFDTVGVNISGIKRRLAMKTSGNK